MIIGRLNLLMVWFLNILPVATLGNAFFRINLKEYLVGPTISNQNPRDELNMARVDRTISMCIKCTTSGVTQASAETYKQN